MFEIVKNFIGVFIEDFALTEQITLNELTSYIIVISLLFFAFCLPILLLLKQKRGGKK